MKCVEIRRNTDGVGSALAAKAVLQQFEPDTEARKLGEQTGLDTLVVPAVNDVHQVLGGSTRSVPQLT